jgi:hypothetical protein
VVLPERAAAIMEASADVLCAGWPSSRASSLVLDLLRLHPAVVTGLVFVFAWEAMAASSPEARCAASQLPRRTNATHQLTSGGIQFFDCNILMSRNS